jgi:putative FmdB family regulatory protein
MMPKYDFKCNKCNSVVEMHMAHDAANKPVCKTCGSAMVKVYTPPSVHFKGGGWGGQS